MARRLHDHRRAAALFTLAAVLLAGAALERRGASEASRASEAISAPAETPPSARSPHEREVRRLFDAAVVMLHARQHEHAAVALDRVTRLAPGLTEAHVNLGFALLGLDRPAQARAAFERALDLHREQANAYYGLALAHEASGDLELATGAMRSYLHLARSERPEHLARARAALWEWQAQRQAGREAGAAAPSQSGRAAGRAAPDHPAR